MCSVDAYWFPTQSLLGVCPGCSKNPDNRGDASWGCVVVAGGGGNARDGVEYDVVPGGLNCLVSTQAASRSSSSADIGSGVGGERELENVVSGGLHYQGVGNGGIETEVYSGGGGELRPGDMALGGQHYLVTAGTREARGSSPLAGTDPDTDGEWEPDEMTPGGQRYSVDTQAASSSEVEVGTATKFNIEVVTGPASEELELDDMTPVDTQATKSNEIEVNTAKKDNIAGEELELDDMTPGEQHYLVVTKDNTRLDADGEWEPDNITPGGRHCLEIDTQVTGDNSPSADVDSDVDGEWEPDDMTPGRQHYLTDTQAACSNEIEGDVAKEDSIEIATDLDAGGGLELDDMTPGRRYYLVNPQIANHNIEATTDPNAGEEWGPDGMTLGGQRCLDNTQLTDNTVEAITEFKVTANSGADGELEPDDMSPGGQHSILDAQTGNDWIEVDVVTNETSATSDVDGEWEPDDMTPGGQHYIFDVQTTSNSDNIETSAGSGEWETDDMAPGGQHHLTAIAQTIDSNVSSPLNLLEGRNNGDYEPTNTAPSDLVEDQEMHSGHANSSGEKQAISNDSRLQKKRCRTAGVSCWATKNKKQKHNHSPPWKNIYAEIPTSFAGKCGERRSGRIGWDNIR